MKTPSGSGPCFDSEGIPVRSCLRQGTQILARTCCIGIHKSALSTPLTPSFPEKNEDYLHRIEPEENPKMQRAGFKTAVFA
jgi:hypothetical protein